MKKRIAVILCMVMTVAMVVTGCGKSESASGGITERFDYDPAATAPTDTSQIAVLKGSWYDMGYQLGEQYKDEVIAATAYNVAGQVESWGSYEEAVKAYDPYLELAEKWFNHEKDGGLKDMIQGTADATGMEFNDAMMLYISADSSIMPGESGEQKTEAEDERDCSAVLTWGNATETDEDGVIGAMKADIGFGDLNFMPAMVMFPDNGYAFISAHGVFGSASNEKGLQIQSPGGSVVNEDEVYRIGIYPTMYLAAYCSTTQEAIDVLGDPETTPQEEWWPFTTDFNVCIGDATGDACDFELTGTERNIRRNGDDKFVGITEAGEAKVANETGDYLAAANWFMGKNMQFTSRLNPAVGIEELWPDGLVRYWTLEKYMQDGIKNGGNNIETIREAMSSYMYYIKDGWDYDAYPDLDYYGTFVPSDIYEGFADGSIKRSEYYGDSYDKDAVGKPMTLSESRRTEEWSAGWHNNLTDGWTWNLDTGYWSPEPYTPDDKTGLINIFDSNTKTMYLLKGSANRAISNIPDSTGTFATLQFADEESSERYGNDSARAMLQNMYHELEEQLWFAARDLTKGKVKETSKRYEYLNDAKELIYTAQNLTSMGYLSDGANEKAKYYAEAMSAYVKGQCYAKMAQDDPETLVKDYGRYEPTMK